MESEERLFFEGPPTIQELYILSRRKFFRKKSHEKIREHLIFFSKTLFLISEQHPWFKFDSTFPDNDQCESKGYEISHEEPEFPPDLFQRFLYREIKFFRQFFDQVAL